MARNGPTSHARKMLLLLLVVIVAMTGTVVAGIFFTKDQEQGKVTWEPKLALDLEGGTQMILAPKVEGSEGQINQEQRSQAVSIIRQRVDGSGVAEAQISTQGDSNIVVSMPGNVPTETRESIIAPANMNFRPVITTSPVVTAVPEDQKRPFQAPTGQPTNGSDANWVTPEIFDQFQNYSCDQDSPATSSDRPMITCDTNKQEKFILGPVEVKGQDIDSASAGLQQGSQGVTTSQWAVNLQFNDEGKAAFGAVTKRLYEFGAQNPQDQRARFAIVLDSKVITAPTSQAAITDGRAQITGNFNETSAKRLADQLKYGALPISFTIQSEQQISATLGTQQLQMGLLAGIIGLILVVVYSLFQYRALGLVTVSSLIVAGLLTYLAIILLGWTQNYRLSLAGVAGLIVSIGQTADSFIVYFERIRDELREGKTLQAAVENGWQRARRTILASKAVNLLAAVVLYFVSVGNVRGFAFTLGLTALADLAVVFWFTHPTLQILATKRFFKEGHSASGLSPERLGVVPLYRGAGKIRTPEDTAVSKKNQGARGEAERRMTVAERKLAEQQRGNELEEESVSVSGSKEQD